MSDPAQVPHSVERPVGRDVRDIIEQALLDYRCARTVDHDGNPLALVDALSPGKTIEDGQAEIWLIADAIAERIAANNAVSGQEPAR